MVKSARRFLMWNIGLLMILFVGLQMQIPAYAVSAEPSPQERRQADGSVITVYHRGDEFFDWFEDEFENIIVYNTQTQNWCYAYVQNNMLLPGSEVVGAMGATYSLTPKVQRNDILSIIGDNIEGSPLYTDRLDNGITLFTQNRTGSRAAAFPKANQELLILLIEFNNVPIQKTSQYWNNQYFGNGKSVSEYYKDMSGGFDIFIPTSTQNIGLESPVTSYVNYDGTDTNINNIPWVNQGVDVTICSEYDGVIKVTFDMPHPIPEYTGTDSVCSQLAMVTMAMKAIQENTNYNFNGFGSNKQVVAIVSGVECSRSDNVDLGGEIWAHTFHFDNDVVGLSGGRIPYTIHGEMYSETDSTTIGVGCHELGHILGLPDLYNTSYSTEGIGYYSLMAYGTWGAVGDDLPGTTPIAFDAWSKYMLGYITPIEYEAHIFETAEIKSAGEIGTVDPQRYNVLRLNNTTVDEKQYFLIENRQNEGWDAGMQYHFGEDFSGGILILQIDENIPLTNLINGVDEHRGVNVVGAQNSGPANRNYFYASDRIRKSLTSDSVPDNSMFYSTIASDPFLNTRDEPSGISIHVKSTCSDTMIVEVGVDSDIVEEFQDERFLAEIRTIIGKTADEPILKSDLTSITSLDVSDKGISSLEGIEYFTGLKELICYFNEFTALDVSGNPELEYLDCSYVENMTSLNIAKNPKLQTLDCNYTALEALDVSHNPNLMTLNCYDCYLGELNLSKNPNLISLDCWGNRLTTLDVTACEFLVYLDCSLNYMTSPSDVSGLEGKDLVLDDNFLFYPQETGQSGEE